MLFIYTAFNGDAREIFKNIAQPAATKTFYRRQLRKRRGWQPGELRQSTRTQKGVFQRQGRQVLTEEGLRSIFGEEQEPEQSRFLLASQGTFGDQRRVPEVDEDEYWMWVARVLKRSE